VVALDVIEMRLWLGASPSLPLSRGPTRPEQWNPVENRHASPVRDLERCVKDTPSVGKTMIRLVLQLYS